MIDRVFASVYRRMRRNYVQFWLTASGLGIVLLAWPAQHITQFVLWGPHLGDGHGLRELAVIMATGVVITVAVMAWAGARQFRPVIRFLRDEPVVPSSVWYASVRALPRIATIASLSYCIVGNTVAVYVAGRHRNFSVSESIAAWIAESLITVTAAFFFILVWEAAYRPVLVDLEPLLPAHFAPAPHWLTLTRRSAFAITSVMVYTGVVASSIAAGFTDREARLWAVVAATLTASATFGGAITGFVSHSIVTRVADLKSALARIGAGDFSVRVALRVGDELDAAGLALNAMAHRLERQDADLRESRARMTSAENDERRRIERDLRVGVDSRLESLVTRMLGVEQMLGPELQESCAELRNSLAAARSEIRSLANGIFPAKLATKGLGPALREAAKRSGLNASCDVDGLERLPAEIETAVYFCCSEAMRNVAKHVGPDARVTLRTKVRHRLLQFTVSDDGPGLSGPAGHGIANMRDRMRSLGGDVAVRSAPGEGTTVVGWMTLQ